MPAIECSEFFSDTYVRLSLHNITVHQRTQNEFEFDCMHRDLFCYCLQFGVLAFVCVCFFLFWLFSLGSVCMNPLIMSLLECWIFKYRHLQSSAQFRNTKKVSWTWFSLSLMWQNSMCSLMFWCPFLPNLPPSAPFYCFFYKSKTTIEAINQLPRYACPFFHATFYSCYPYPLFSILPLWIRIPHDKAIHGWPYIVVYA